MVSTDQKPVKDFWTVACGFKRCYGSPIDGGLEFRSVLDEQFDRIQFVCSACVNEG